MDVGRRREEEFNGGAKIDGEIYRISLSALPPRGNEVISKG